jgi:hypothetical protein
MNQKENESKALLQVPVELLNFSRNTINVVYLKKGEEGLPSPATPLFRLHGEALEVLPRPDTKQKKKNS